MKTQTAVGEISSRLTLIGVTSLLGRGDVKQGATDQIHQIFWPVSSKSCISSVFGSKILHWKGVTLSEVSPEKEGGRGWGGGGWTQNKCHTGRLLRLCSVTNSNTNFLWKSGWFLCVPYNPPVDCRWEKMSSPIICQYDSTMNLM